MPTEIEHKYLVDKNLWRQVTSDKYVQIRQGYLLTDPDKTVRIRTSGEKGFITIKGKTVGASRPEFEYEIPIEEANQLINTFCSSIIEKTRHYVNHENKTWEVDVFEGLNFGLMVAEIELQSEDETYIKPNWVELNVTNDNKYANSNLTIRPYSTW
jgi:adenylate cyclase